MHYMCWECEVRQQQSAARQVKQMQAPGYMNRSQPKHTCMFAPARTRKIAIAFTSCRSNGKGAKRQELHDDCCGTSGLQLTIAGHIRQHKLCRRAVRMNRSLLNMLSNGCAREKRHGPLFPRRECPLQGSIFVSTTPRDEAPPRQP